MAEQMTGEEETPSFWNLLQGAPSLDTKADAVENYRDNAVHMANFMNRFREAGDRDPSDAGSKTNTIRNSVEWIESGEATLHVMTPTHDSDIRAAADGKAGQSAYFDDRVDYRTMGNYNEGVNSAGHPTQNAGVHFARAGVGGFMSNDGHDLFVFDPKTRSDSKLSEVFIHEVQHDADQHRSGENWESSEGQTRPGDSYTAPRWVYNSYKTEFRAYWMNSEDSRGDAFGHSANTRVTHRSFNAAHANVSGAVQRTGSASTNFQNGRQEGIFNHMFRNQASDSVYLRGSNWTQSYAYLPHYYVFDERFRAMVDNMSVPAAGNLINSVRIQDLSDAIATRNGNRVREAIDALDAMDRNYLNDRTLTEDFWGQAQSQMNQGTVDYLLARLRS
ncbi:MAG: hypothetical protein ACJAZO_004945 [Myxococcota bacterium]|jgi:hypothetical protein